MSYPARANATAAALPMPLADPVTSAALELSAILQASRTKHTTKCHVRPMVKRGKACGLKQMVWMAPAPRIAMCQSVVSIKDHEQKEPSAMNVSIIGLDLAKNVFQVHAIDDGGEVIVRRALWRRQMLPFFRKLEAIQRLAIALTLRWALPL
jgi:hypothetical protein